MSRRKSYRLDRVVVEPGERRPASWTFGGDPQQGFEQIYHVTDGNFDGRNHWEFVVRIPKRAGDPAGGAADERRPTCGRGRSCRTARSSSCAARWAMPRGSGTAWRPSPTSAASGAGPSSAPISATSSRPGSTASATGCGPRRNVKRTRGTDGGALVLLVPEDDHAAMIRLFFALKVWVLKEGFELRA